MKTPMQELIKELKESLIGSNSEPHRTSERIYIKKAIDLATKQLEKEKQCIIDAYHEGKRNHGIHTVNESEQYYTDLTNQ